MPKREETERKVKLRLSQWQRKFILDGFDDPLRIAVTGIGAGKSRALAIWIVMQCIRKPGLRGIVIAQIYKTLSRVLVREIQVVCSLLGVEYSYNKSSMEMSFTNGSVLFFYSGDNATGILGLSEIDMLALDESAYIGRDVYDFARDRMRGGKYEPMVRLISSPVNDVVENWFRDVCDRHPECVVTATTFDNPFVSRQFLEELKDRYVEGTNLFKQQVLGMFMDTDVASQLLKRADFAKEKGEKVARGYWMGADFSGGVGCDADTVAIIDDAGVVEIQEDNELNTQQKVAVIRLEWDKYSPAGNYVDNTGGFGMGSIDLAAEKGIRLNGANFSEKPFDEKNYPNLRTEAYCELARDIRAGFWVPPEVQKELLAHQVTVDNRGRVSLVPKDLVKKILGHSPDKSDSVALANYARNHSGCTVDGDVSPEKAEEIQNRYMAYFNQG